MAGLAAGEVEVHDSAFLALGSERSLRAVHGGYPAGVSAQTNFGLLRGAPSTIGMITVGANDTEALFE